MSGFDCTAQTTQLLVIDVQERFTAAIPSIAIDGDCGKACSTLIKGCALLSVPITFSEQYPQGLGQTLDELSCLAPAAACLSKTHFSCADDKALRDHLAQIDRDHVIICGIEAHVCVLGTVDDLIRRGYNVMVAADAVASRHPENRDYALAAMRQLGALVLPVESILFRMQRQAGVGNFKEISRLVR